MAEESPSALAAYLQPRGAPPTSPRSEDDLQRQLLESVQARVQRSPGSAAGASDLSMSSAASAEFASPRRSPLDRLSPAVSMSSASEDGERYQDAVGEVEDAASEHGDTTEEEEDPDRTAGADDLPALLASLHGHLRVDADAVLADRPGVQWQTIDMNVWNAAVAEGQKAADGPEEGGEEALAAAGDTPKLLSPSRAADAMQEWKADDGAADAKAAAEFAGQGWEDGKAGWQGRRLAKAAAGASPQPEAAGGEPGRELAMVEAGAGAAASAGAGAAGGPSGTPTAASAAAAVAATASSGGNWSPQSFGKWQTKAAELVQQQQQDEEEARQRTAEQVALEGVSFTATDVSVGQFKGCSFNDCRVTVDPESSPVSVEEDEQHEEEGDGKHQALMDRIQRLRESEQARRAEEVQPEPEPEPQQVQQVQQQQPSQPEQQQQQQQQQELAASDEQVILVASDGETIFGGSPRGDVGGRNLFAPTGLAGQVRRVATVDEAAPGQEQAGDGDGNAQQHAQAQAQAEKPPQEVVEDRPAKPDPMLPLKKKLRSLSYGTKGQDPWNLFSMYDKNRSGELDFREFVAAIRKGGKMTPQMVSEKELRALFRSVDADGSGDVSIDELILFVWGEDGVANPTPRQKEWGEMSFNERIDQEAPSPDAASPHAGRRASGSQPPPVPVAARPSTASVPAAAAPRLDVSAREKSLRESSKQRKRDAESNNSPVVRTIPGRSPVVRKQARKQQPSAKNAKPQFWTEARPASELLGRDLEPNIPIPDRVARGRSPMRPAYVAQPERLIAAQDEKVLMARLREEPRGERSARRNSAAVDETKAAKGSDGIVSGTPSGRSDRTSSGATALEQLAVPGPEDRRALFRRLDSDGSGLLPFSQVLTAMRELFDDWDNPQALKWAYNAAGLSKEGRVQEWEFRAVLRHAVYFSNHWAQFQTVQDGGDDGDTRLMSLKEFLLACAVVGVGVRKQDAVESFYDLDTAGAGYIPFDGFCAWCSRQQLSQSPDAEGEIEDRLERAAASASPTTLLGLSSEYGADAQATSLAQQRTLQTTHRGSAMTGKRVRKEGALTSARGSSGEIASARTSWAGFASGSTQHTAPRHTSPDPPSRLRESDRATGRSPGAKVNLGSWGDQEAESAAGRRRRLANQNDSRSRKAGREDDDASRLEQENRDLRAQLVAVRREGRKDLALAVKQAEGLAEYCAHLESVLARKVRSGKLPRVREMRTQTEQSFLRDVAGAGHYTAAVRADWKETARELAEEDADAVEEGQEHEGYGGAARTPVAWAKEPLGHLSPEVELSLRKILWETIRHGRSLYGRPCTDLASFFNAVDHDDCEAVTRLELSQALTRLDVGIVAAQLDSLLATIDADHNGVISYKEFKRWMGDPPGTAARRSPPRERPPWDGSIYSAETLADSSPLRDVAKSSDKSSPKGASEDASLEPAELLKSYREDLASDRPSSVKEAIAAVRRRTGGMDATVDGGGGMADASTVAAEMKRCLDIEHEVEVLQARFESHGTSLPLTRARALDARGGVGYVLHPMDGAPVELRLEMDAQDQLVVQVEGRANEELLSFLARATGAG